MDGQGKVIGKKAPDFTLANQDGEPTSLSELLLHGPLLIVFYPSDFTPVCTAQLCNYRDNAGGFEKERIQVVGISKNDAESHRRFRAKYDIPFPLLSDPKNLIATAFGCQSLLLFGRVSRAVFIVSQDGMILYRYVEPTPLSRRNANELIGIVRDLRAQSLL